MRKKNIFFDEKGQETKGFKILSLVVTIVAAGWGLSLSYLALDQSKTIEYNQNHIKHLDDAMIEMKAQTELLTDYVNEMRQMVTIMRGDSTTQHLQLQSMNTGQKVANMPKLILREIGTGDKEVTIVLENKGALLYNFRAKSKDNLLFSPNPQIYIEKDDFFNLSVKNMTKKKHEIIFEYTDKGGIPYTKKISIVENNGLWSEMK